MNLLSFDAKIIECLQSAYGLNIETVSLLPIGADFNTAVYRITTTDETDYFLKLRSGDFLQASISAPKYLANLGIKQVIAPIPTKTGQLCLSLSSFKAILYPYVDSQNGVEAKLSEAQWEEFGATVKKLHEADIPASITKDVPQETFASKWRETVKAFLARIENEVFEEPVAVKTSEFLSSKSAEILKIIKKTEALALHLKTKPIDRVLCHADIHGWNLIIDKEGALYVVDWDTLIYAPKEQDLMFIGSGIWDSGLTTSEEESLFYKGYGQIKINYDAICYYRFERIIQDIGQYCNHIFLTDDDNAARLQSLEYLQSNWRANGTIEKAYQADNII